MILILRSFFLLITVFVLQACSKKGGSSTEEVTEGYNWSKHTPFTTSYGTFNMPFSDLYNNTPSSQGYVQMTEASGIAWSVVNPGYIWAHNDSGHTNSIYLINVETGAIVATYQVDGTVNMDWEDIEVAKGPVNGVSYIYISDTGDNDQKKGSYSIYRFEEPKLLPEHVGKLNRINNIPVDRIVFAYPDGSHDAEAMLVDPETKDIFLITKRDVVSILYVLPYPQKINEAGAACYKAGSFSFRQASAANCSADGNKVLIKNRQEIFYWERLPGESMVQLLERTPVKVPYAGEVQGEAICFDLQNNYYTLSEKADYPDYPILYKYTLK